MNRIECDGYAVQEDVLSETEIDQLIDAIERREDGLGLLPHGRIFAVRNLLDVPEFRKLAESEPVSELARTVLGCDAAFPVRGILFDKIPEANWKVPWHQDVTIAVQEREEIEGIATFLVIKVLQDRDWHPFQSATEVEPSTMR